MSLQTTTLTYCCLPVSKYSRWTVPSTLSRAFHPYTLCRSSGQVKSLCSSQLTTHSSCLLLLSQPYLSAVFYQTVLSLRMLETTKANQCLLVLSQHGTQELDQSLTALILKPVGIPKPIRLASSIQSYDPLRTVIPRISALTVHHRQCSKGLKSACFPHRAGYSLNNTTHIYRDAGNQAALSCCFCTQMNCMTT